MTPTTLDSAAVRQQHTTLVLRTIGAEGELSRADLARRLGLARSTVSAIVDDLLASSIVRELRQGASAGGRRPTILALDEGTYRVVGVDIGATHVRVLLADLKARTLATHHRACAVRDDPTGTLAVVEELVARVLTESRRQGGVVVGLGVGMPSPVDPRDPGRLSPVVLPAWAGVDVAGRLRARFELPVLIDNDANLGALCESRWGHGAGVDSLAYVKVATGVGAGLVFDGRILRGTAGMAGELGHLAIDSAGPLCRCGLRGCLNVLIGTAPLLARVRQRARSARDKTIDSLDALIDAAQGGSAVAEECLDYAGRTLGLGLAMLLNLVNPAVVAVGGGIVRAGELLLGPLRTTVAKHSFSENMSHVRIVPSGLGAEATARGAATLVLEAALQDPEAFFVVAAPRKPAARAGARNTAKQPSTAKARTQSGSTARTTARTAARSRS